MFLSFTGLFTADQPLAGDLPIYTRQNCQGTIRGVDVPEERDYYPYWGPTPWRDIAILVSDEKTEGLVKKYVNSPNYGLKCKAYHQQYSIIVVSIPLILISYFPS